VPTTSIFAKSNHVLAKQCHAFTKFGLGQHPSPLSSSVSADPARVA